MVCCDYEFIRKWTKILTYLSALIIIGLGIAKFFNITQLMQPIDYIVNVYLIFLGIVLIACELGWERVLKHFNFMRYFLGKSMYVLL